MNYKKITIILLVFSSLYNAENDSEPDKKKSFNENARHFFIDPLKKPFSSKEKAISFIQSNSFVLHKFAQGLCNNKKKSALALLTLYFQLIMQPELNDGVKSCFAKALLSIFIPPLAGRAYYNYRSKSPDRFSDKHLNKTMRVKKALERLSIKQIRRNALFIRFYMHKINSAKPSKKIQYLSKVLENICFLNSAIGTYVGRKDDFDERVSIGLLITFLLKVFFLSENTDDSTITTSCKLIVTKLIHILLVYIEDPKVKQETAKFIFEYSNTLAGQAAWHRDELNIFLAGKESELTKPEANTEGLDTEAKTEQDENDKIETTPTENLEKSEKFKDEALDKYLKKCIFASRILCSAAPLIIDIIYRI